MAESRRASPEVAQLSDVKDLLQKSYVEQRENEMMFKNAPGLNILKSAEEASKRRGARQAVADIPIDSLKNFIPPFTAGQSRRPSKESHADGSADAPKKNSAKNWGKVKKTVTNMRHALRVARAFSRKQQQETRVQDNLLRRHVYQASREILEDLFCVNDVRHSIRDIFHVVTSASRQIILMRRVSDVFMSYLAERRARNKLMVMAQTHLKNPNWKEFGYKLADFQQEMSGYALQFGEMADIKIYDNIVGDIRRNIASQLETDCEAERAEKRLERAGAEGTQKRAKQQALQEAEQFVDVTEKLVAQRASHLHRVLGFLGKCSGRRIVNTYQMEFLADQDTSIVADLPQESIAKLRGILEDFTTNSEREEECRRELFKLGASGEDATLIISAIRTDLVLEAVNPAIEKFTSQSTRCFQSIRETIAKRKRPPSKERASEEIGQSPMIEGGPGVHDFIAESSIRMRRMREEISRRTQVDPIENVTTKTTVELESAEHERNRIFDDLVASFAPPPLDLTKVTVSVLTPSVSDLTPSVDNVGNSNVNTDNSANPDNAESSLASRRDSTRTPSHNLLSLRRVSQNAASAVERHARRWGSWRIALEGYKEGPHDESHLDATPDSQLNTTLGDLHLRNKFQSQSSFGSSSTEKFSSGNLQDKFASGNLPEIRVTGDCDQSHAWSESSEQRILAAGCGKSAEHSFQDLQSQAAQNDMACKQSGSAAAHRSVSDKGQEQHGSTLTQAAVLMETHVQHESNEKPVHLRLEGNHSSSAEKSNHSSSAEKSQTSESHGLDHFHVKEYRNLAVGCLEEGCPVDMVSDLLSKLKEDSNPDPKLAQIIRELEKLSASSDANQDAISKLVATVVASVAERYASLEKAQSSESHEVPGFNHLDALHTSRGDASLEKTQTSESHGVPGFNHLDALHTSSGDVSIHVAAEDIAGYTMWKKEPGSADKTNLKPSDPLSFFHISTTPWGQTSTKNDGENANPKNVLHGARTSLPKSRRASDEQRTSGPVSRASLLKRQRTDVANDQLHKNAHKQEDQRNLPAPESTDMIAISEEGPHPSEPLAETLCSVAGAVPDHRPTHTTQAFDDMKDDETERDSTPYIFAPSIIASRLTSPSTPRSPMSKLSPRRRQLHIFREKMNVESVMYDRNRRGHLHGSAVLDPWDQDEQRVQKRSHQCRRPPVHAGFCTTAWLAEDQTTYMMKNRKPLLRPLGWEATYQTCSIR